MDTEIALGLSQLGESTGRLLATADALTDAQVAAPSRLPGWTRGHVLTHLARNADGFRNLLSWAATGDETPMYPSEEARARGVEEGAARSAAEIAADLHESAAALTAAAQDLPARAWDAPVARRGVTFPAREIPSRRLAELEIHHVDLDAGYRPADWPASFVAAQLVPVARDFAGRADAPACLARPDGLDAVYPIGPVAPDLASTGLASQVTVSGPPAALLAWLIGRDNGTRLKVTGAGAAPVLPPWR